MVAGVRRTWFGGWGSVMCGTPTILVPPVAMRGWGDTWQISPPELVRSHPVLPSPDHSLSGDCSITHPCGGVLRQADWPTRVRSADQGSELAHAGDLYWSEAAGAGGGTTGRSPSHTIPYTYLILLYPRIPTLHNSRAWTMASRCYEGMATDRGAQGRASAFLPFGGAVAAA